MGLADFSSGEYQNLMNITSRVKELSHNLAQQDKKKAERPTMSAAAADRGRDADHPKQLPSRGWKDVLWRAWREVSTQNLSLMAGGVTYAMLLALFPGLAALVSVYGLAFDAGQIEQQIRVLAGVLPQQTLDLLGEQLHSLVQSSHGALGLSAIIGLLLALWSASRGTSGLISALNIAYEEQESRSFIKFNMIALGLTISILIGGSLIIALVAALPAAVQFLHLGTVAKWALLVIEWPLLIVLLMVGLAVLYRYAPNRDEPKWRWVSPGAIAATVLWMLGSAGFTAYVSYFNSYNKTYGTLGGIVILLTWLYLSAFVILFGAIINAQSEKQTRKDSTEGKPAPMGQRGARAADTLGESAG